MTSSSETDVMCPETMIVEFDVLSAGRVAGSG
jgi:hypothetical protein